MHPPDRRELAIKLREAGYSYPYISQRTGLSKSTLSGWLTDVPFRANEKTVRAFGKARAAATERKARKRLEAVQAIRTIAQKEIGSINKRDLFMFGLGLYVGEGAKTHSNVRIVNADPKVIVAMIAWFRSLGVETNQFAARVYLYPDSDIARSLRFWSKTTSIPLSQFAKPQIDRRLDKKAKKHGKLPHGTMHLGLRSKGRKEFGIAFFWKILAWNEDMLQKASAGLV